MYTIAPNHAFWKANYQDTSICGPTAVSINRHTILKNVECRIDSVGEDLMEQEKCRFFRKGGARIHFSTGHYPDGNSITSAAHFSGNSCRITTDLKWKNGNVLKDSFEVNSFSLPGKWKRMLLLPGFTWKDIPEKGTVELAPLPPAVVFENEDGLRLETGCGDDLWRWNQGITENAGTGKLVIASGRNGLEVRRIVTQIAGPEPAAVAARFYRFETYFAWSAPELHSEFDTSKALQIAIGDDGIANYADIADAPENSCLVLALPDQIPAADNCWESRPRQRIFRKIIRQLSEISKKMNLQVDKGLTPCYCKAGVHINKKADMPHWDIGAILEVSCWMKQALGSDWTICVKQPENWNELPSMNCLGADNGFADSAKPED